MPSTRAKTYPSPINTSKSNKFGEYLNKIRTSSSFKKPKVKSNKQESGSEGSSSTSEEFSDPHLLFNPADTQINMPFTGEGPSVPSAPSAPEMLSRYKNVITWIRPFDGSLERYMRFSNDCDKCFRVIDPRDYADLLLYVTAQLDEERFAFLLGTQFRTWKELKKCLDEHFNIRNNEKKIFREIADMKRDVGESLFNFYNRLVAKCFEYRQFIGTSSDNGNNKFKIQQIEDYALESFIHAVNINFRPVLISKEPKTIQEAYAILQKFEVAAGVQGNDSVNDKLNEVIGLIKEVKIEKEEFANPRIRRNEITGLDSNIKTCQFCGRSGHTAKFCFDIVNNSNRNNFNGNYNGGNQNKNYADNNNRNQNQRYQNNGGNMNGFNRQNSNRNSFNGFSNRNNSNRNNNLSNRNGGNGYNNNNFNSGNYNGGNFNMNYNPNNNGNFNHNFNRNDNTRGDNSAFRGNRQISNQQFMHPNIHYGAVNPMQMQYQNVDAQDYPQAPNQFPAIEYGNKGSK